MPKDIIIIIIIIINIIIIIKALTDTQGLKAKAEECQAGIAAEGTASPSSGDGVMAAPSLSRWNLCSQSSAARGWSPVCPSEPIQSTAATGRDLSRKDDPAVPAKDIPLIPDPTRIWAQLPLGQAQGTGWKSTLASPGIQPGCTSTWILQLPWNQLWGPKDAQCPAEL